MVEREHIHVMFRAVDNFSPVKRAEYSVDAGDWQFVEPIDQISDSKAENYDFRITLPGASATDAEAVRSGRSKKAGGVSQTQSTRNDVEHVIVVRAYDRFDNMGTAKTLIRH